MISIVYDTYTCIEKSHERLIHIASTVYIGWLLSANTLLLVSHLIGTHFQNLQVHVSQ